MYGKKEKKRKRKGEDPLFLFSTISNVDKQKKGTRMNEREIPENDRKKSKQSGKREWGSWKRGGHASRSHIFSQ